MFIYISGYVQFMSIMFVLFLFYHFAILLLTTFFHYFQLAFIWLSFSCQGNNIFKLFITSFYIVTVSYPVYETDLFV